MRRYLSRITVLSFLLGTALSIGGCAPETRTVTLPAEPPESFSASGTQNMPERWWTAFENEELNAAVDTALSSNFSVRVAWERLNEARAVTDRESSALLPDLQASAQGEASSSEREFEDGGNMQLGLSSVYEVDLWGQISSRIEAEEYRTRATFADYQTAAISLSADVVTTWYQLVEAQNQLALVEEQIETNTDVLELLENRFGAGQVRGVDILRQQQLVEATREQRSSVVSQVEMLEHRLAVLMGRSPREEVTALPEQLPEPPPPPETGVPMDLVQRRPDVQSAFYRLEVADRELATAISDQYPQVTLTASASSAANSAAGLFRDWALSFGGDLLAPIFRGGALRAEVDRTEAVKQQRLFAYGQTVLTAFQEVEDALAQEESQRDRIQNMEEQLDLAQQAYDQLLVQYFNGASEYLDVLTALDEVQQLRRDLLSAELALLEYRVALYRALAGPFETGREDGDITPLN